MVLVLVFDLGRGILFGIGSGIWSSLDLDAVVSFGGGIWYLVWVSDLEVSYIHPVLCRFRLVPTSWHMTADAYASLRFTRQFWFGPSRVYRAAVTFLL